MTYHLILVPNIQKNVTKQVLEEVRKRFGDPIDIYIYSTPEAVQGIPEGITGLMVVHSMEDLEKEGLDRLVKEVREKIDVFTRPERVVIAFGVVVAPQAFVLAAASVHAAAEVYAVWFDLSKKTYRVARFDTL